MDKLDKGVKLPSWATHQQVPSKKRWEIIYDPNEVYPKYLELLSKAGCVRGETKVSADKYWVEVARRCASEDLKLVTEGAPLSLHIRPAEEHFDEETGRVNQAYPWRLSNLPGTAEDEAKGSFEFRRYWNMVDAKDPNRDRLK